MINKSSIIIIAVGAILTFVAVSVIAQIVFNQTANVPATGTVTYYFNGAVFTSGTMAWGDINPSQTLTRPLNVTNNKNTPITVILIAALPDGWTEAWSLNNTVIPQSTEMAGTVSLTAPADATAGAVSFSSTLEP